MKSRASSTSNHARNVYSIRGRDCEYKLFVSRAFNATASSNRATYVLVLIAGGESVEFSATGDKRSC